jgi:hypothetical protein
VWVFWLASHKSTPSQILPVPRTQPKWLSCYNSISEVHLKRPKLQKDMQLRSPLSTVGQ